MCKLYIVAKVMYLYTRLGVRVLGYRNSISRVYSMHARGYCRALATLAALVVLYCKQTSIRHSVSLLWHIIPLGLQVILQCCMKIIIHIST